MIEAVENIVTEKGKGDEAGYTIFRNNNKELVEKIKAVTILEDTFEYWVGKQYVKQFSMPKRGLLMSSKNEIIERILPVINKLRLK